MYLQAVYLLVEFADKLSPGKLMEEVMFIPSSGK